jgi:hypothetical protein
MSDNIGRRVFIITKKPIEAKMDLNKFKRKEKRS